MQKALWIRCAVFSMIVSTGGWGMAQSTPASQASGSASSAPAAGAVPTTLAVEVAEATPPTGADLAAPGALSEGFSRLLGSVVRLDVWETDFDDGMRRTMHGFGSGAIVDEQGHIITNAHVVNPYAERILVTLNSLERVSAKLVGWDHWTDLAVVQLDMNEMKNRGLTFNHADFGSSGSLQPGQTVFAVGTPNGLSRTVTRGIISNNNRFFEGSTVGNGYETGYFNTWLQTDAAINPGNSGGPLALPDGRIIGINTSAYLGANNLAFAVPSDIARSVLEQLISKGSIERSYIGLQPGPMQDLETFFHLKVNQGMLVQSIDPGSPADKAGLRPGDIVMTMNGRPVDGRFPEQLPAIQQEIAATPVGAKVAFEVSRQGKLLPLEVETEVLQSRVGKTMVLPQWGLSVQKVSRAVAREEQLRSDAGVRVVGVQTGFPGSEAGIQRDDIILAVNGEKIESMEQLQQIYEGYAKVPQRMLLEVNRNRQALYLALRPR